MKDMMKNRKAIYPGSFDPPTLGHTDIIRRSARLFDRVIVAILPHRDKSPLFTVEERLRMLQTCLRDCNNIEILSHEGLLVDLAKIETARVIIRGLRFVTDFDHELQMALMNRKLRPETETLFMTTAETHSHISSSLVKEIATYGGDISSLVPPEVADKIIRKIHHKKDLNG